MVIYRAVPTSLYHRELGGESESVCIRQGSFGIGPDFSRFCCISKPNPQHNSCKRLSVGPSPNFTHHSCTPGFVEVVRPRGVRRRIETLSPLFLIIWFSVLQCWPLEGPVLGRMLDRFMRFRFGVPGHRCASLCVLRCRSADFYLSVFCLWIPLVSGPCSVSVVS
jgi:hypothetical protein